MEFRRRDEIKTIYRDVRNIINFKVSDLTISTYI